jgi:hypothetical protein
MAAFWMASSLRIADIADMVGLGRVTYDRQKYVSYVNKKNVCETNTYTSLSVAETVLLVRKDI